MFIDYAEIFVKAGDGGNGAVAFRREKFVPKGGPAGGNGGAGGNIIIKADNNLHTLLDFRYNRKYIAPNGANGGTSLKDGKNGKDVTIKVPVGTLIKNKESSKVIADLDQANKDYVIVKGGKGGRGNSNFATPTNQAPRYAEDGKQGKEFFVSFELKLLADVGLVGFPNAGKSTLISVISAARPKIADYPFTTLEPNLGIVKYKDFKSFVVADIPGIIEGAHEGKGLGHKFLRHIERTKILLILIDAIEEDFNTKYKTLIGELERYSKVLSGKEKYIALSKSDLLDESKLKELSKIKIKNYDGPMFIFSSVSGSGIPQILDFLWEKITA